MLGHEEREGVDYEFSIRWHQLQAERPPSPRVDVFDDSWLAFAELADVFAWLAFLHGTDPTPKQVCDGLLAMGFEDRTERARQPRGGTP